MDTNTLAELKHAMLSDAAFRRALLLAFQRDIDAGMMREDNGVVKVLTREEGVITYEEAARMCGCGPSTPKTWVSLQYCRGGGGYINREDLIKHVMERGRKQLRAKLVAYLDRERAMVATAKQSLEPVA